MVRDCLDELGLSYQTIHVPAPHAQRIAVLAVSGQTLVPVLVDGNVVLDDEEKIVAYLHRTYGESRS